MAGSTPRWRENVGMAGAKTLLVPLQFKKSVSFTSVNLCILQMLSF